MGFPLADQTGANSYSGIDVIGKEFLPQFFLLDYTPPENLQEAVDASINETGSGELEVIRYGTKKLMRCNIDFVTNENMGADSWIETNSTGIEDCLDFLRDITQKSKIEFMPDRDNASDFKTFVLESTASNRSGLGYELREKTGEGQIGYFTTGLLTFRLLE